VKNQAFSATISVFVVISAQCQDRDIAAAEVMLYYAQGNLPGLGTSLVDAVVVVVI
jgi:hypothetical protein